MQKSLPSWECGLKYPSYALLCLFVLVTPFVGVWIEIWLISVSVERSAVTPFVGVWIEMFYSNHWVIFTIKSLPSWECGLKSLGDRHDTKRPSVTPFVGVWIEIQSRATPLMEQPCHSLRGSVDWNQRSAVTINQWLMSLPSWECGLKSEVAVIVAIPSLVTPFVGVWIEIILKYPQLIVYKVTPFVGVWIEIQNQKFQEHLDNTSLPSWECGLKY